MRYCLQSRVDTFKREKEFDLIDKKIKKTFSEW